MRKFIALALALAFVLSLSAVAFAGDNPLRNAEKKFHKSISSLIPKDKLVTVSDLHKKWMEVLAGKSKAYLLDVRTHPEFDAFHIEGSSHIHSGHMYTIPKKIKDPNAEIWIYCRTQHRAGYVAGMLYKWGYKNVYYVVKTDKKIPGGIVGWVKSGYPIVNYFFGYADKDGIHYVKQGKLKERNCGNWIREFSGQRGEKCK